MIYEFFSMAFSLPLCLCPASASIASSPPLPPASHISLSLSQNPSALTSARVDRCDWSLPLIHCSLFAKNLFLSFYHFFFVGRCHQSPSAIIFCWLSPTNYIVEIVVFWYDFFLVLCFRYWWVRFTFSFLSQFNFINWWCVGDYDFRSWW